MLGGLEADVLPALAAVIGAVDAVTVADAALAIVLPCTDPDDIRILRIDGDTADGIGSFAVERGVSGRRR